MGRAVVIMMLFCAVWSLGRGDGCSQDGARDATAFQFLIGRMKAESNSITRQEIFEASLGTSDRGFSSEQVLQVVMTLAMIISERNCMQWVDNSLLILWRFRLADVKQKA